MIKILHGHEVTANWPLFDYYFKLRHEMFVIRRQWNLPVKEFYAEADRHDGDVRATCYEIDQYDDDDAVYFFSIHDGGGIEACARVTPTTTASLMADYFPHLNESGESLRSPAIYEATRYIISTPEKSRNYLRKLKSDLFVRMTEWYMDQGLTHLQSVIDASALPMFLDMTIRTRPLGLAHNFGGGPGVKGGGRCLGIRWEMNDDLLADFLTYGDASDNDVSDADRRIPVL